MFGIGFAVVILPLLVRYKSHFCVADSGINFKPENAFLTWLILDCLLGRTRRICEYFRRVRIRKRYCSPRKSINSLYLGILFLLIHSYLIRLIETVRMKREESGNDWWSFVNFLSQSSNLGFKSQTIHWIS